MYCTIENIQNLIPSGVLSQLTNNDTNLIADAITSAEASVNAYLQGSYDINYLADCALLKDISEKITVYNLYTRFSGDETPQIVSTNYKIAISQLEKIQSGALSLGNIDNTPKDRQSEVFSNKTSEDKMFSMATLKEF